jgi:hypothetical protein
MFHPVDKGGHRDMALFASFLVLARALWRALLGRRIVPDKAITSPRATAQRGRFLLRWQHLPDRSRHLRKRMNHGSKRCKRWLFSGRPSCADQRDSGVMTRTAKSLATKYSDRRFLNLACGGPGDVVRLLTLLTASEMVLNEGRIFWKRRRGLGN